MNLFLRRFSKLLCACVALLIFAGAMVTSHDAGLSVPDWPTSYGHNMFLFPPSRWVGGIFYEHVHRLIASVIGLLTVILAAAMAKQEKRRWVRRLSYAALAAVIVQGILGGLTVKLLLPASVSVAHALLAQTFFVLVIVIAYAESEEFGKRAARGEEAGERVLLKAALSAAGAVYLQLFFGAVMRHTGAGLAVPDLPTTGGSLLPWLSAEALARINEMRAGLGLVAPVGRLQVAAHLLHRFWALMVIGAVLELVWRGMDASSAELRRFRTTALAAGVLVVFQFGLGVLALGSLREPVITSLHVMLGALLLGVTVLAALRVWLPGAKH